MLTYIELDDDMDRDGFKNFINNNKDIVILKFSADWCGPCQTIKPYIEESIQNLESFMKENKTNKNVKFCEVIVDDYFDIYSTLKQKKMVKGIPHIMCYFGKKNKDRLHYYISDLSVSGTDKNEINNFFNLIKNHL
ncbi:hypothetical protein CL656_05305 [bacterium]|nr:hypothetical protein [bacterium]|tara:strand:- start:457 stop:864 length:408 start_codon:yes stop_codon:yes gene_type:complete